MALNVVINGTNITAAGAYLERGWELHRPANGRALFRGSVISDDGTYRPLLDHEVALSGDETFGGEIDGILERGSGKGDGIETEIRVRDFSSRPTRRYVTATIPAGTLKAALQAIVPFIHGVTLDPAQVNGPALPELVYADVRADEVLAQLVELTEGWIVEIDHNEVLRMYEPGTVAAPFNITATNGKALEDIEVEIVRQDYANHVIVRNATIRKTATDASHAANPWEVRFDAPDETTADAMQALADAILARSLASTLRRVSYPTDEPGLKPGMTQTINYPKRNLNNTFLILEVGTQEIGGGNRTLRVTAIEGLGYQTDWRETYRRWNGGASTVVGGSGGGAPIARFAYPLGGVSSEYVESDAPTWVPAGGGAIGASPYQVQIDTVARGTLNAIVKGRVRALNAGVSVRARLYDVTAGAACSGLSAVVTSVAWETISFGVVLNAGTHIYELQLLPGAANEPVQAGNAYVE